MDEHDDLAIPPNLRRTREEIPSAESPSTDHGLSASAKQSEPMACRGILVSMKPLKVSGKLRIEVEIEKEFANDAFEKLGKFPDPAKSRWVGLAVIQTEGE